MEIQIKKESNLSLFANDILYTETLKTPAKTVRTNKQIW